MIALGGYSSSSPSRLVGVHRSASRSSSPNSLMVRPTAAAKALPASLILRLTSGSSNAADTEPATWFQAPASVPKASLISSSVGPSSLATLR